MLKYIFQLTSLLMLLQTVTNEVTNQINLIEKAYNALMEKLISWFKLAISSLPNFIVALLVLTVFYFLAKGVKSILNKTLSKWV
ncbi:MAG: hypothetical protein COZ18_01800, partial [Flexibacter sp. CG_4_10_14_3_um_filter_32_15]